jgi:quercetin dioxygenase-like cupin family protein
VAPQRVFEIARHLQPTEGEPLRSVVTETVDAAVVAWHVAPGQRISPHRHPHGQDTWTVLSGRGLYQLDADGRTTFVRAGDVVVAPTGAVHGVLNDGEVDLVILSVVSPAASGYEPLA